MSYRKVLTSLGYTGMDPLEDLGEPVFEEATKVQDWRNHVPGILINAWPRLSPEARAAIFIVAEIAANNEQWE